MWFNIAHIILVDVLMFCITTLAVPATGNIARLIKRQLPAEPTGVKTLTSPNGYDIRYSEPGKSGVCETTPGVNSYSGYIDIDAETHMFFWFFEARSAPNESPITLWLEGGPGADSLFGLFDLVGPCYVTENLTTELNPNSFNEVSNVLFLSQPIGVGFSYADKVVGTINDTTGLPQNSSIPDGRYANVDPLRTTTTSAAAVTAWEILQAFFQELPTFDPNVQSRDFSLWTESFGGHYGPTFFEYFYEQNELIKTGDAQGVSLNLHSLGVINGIIDVQVQTPYYPEYAYNNQYGIQLVNETIYEFMKMAWAIPGGCSDYLESCYASDITTLLGQITCAAANAVCREMVEGPAELTSGRSPYDIRASDTANYEPSYWMDYVNTAFVQNALGVDLNYTSATSLQVVEGFSLTGDWALNKLPDIEKLLDHGVRVALIYGDADYLANWMGGEAVSLAANYTYSAEFGLAGYAPFVVDGVEYGESRQYGNFSFTRVYEAGHDVPYYQPVAALELFRRVLGDLAVSDGSVKVTPTYKSNGTAQATHTESWVDYYTGRPGPE